MAITIIAPPVEAPWRIRRREQEGAVMGSQKVPAGVDLFENFCTFKICSNGRYIFAGMTKSKGIVIFDVERILYEMPKNDYGAPQLEWRPSDDQLIVISVTQGGEMIQIDAVPGIYRSG